jgi:hypothetical protein
VLGTRLQSYFQRECFVLKGQTSVVTIAAKFDEFDINRHPDEEDLENTRNTSPYLVTFVHYKDNSQNEFIYKLINISLNTSIFNMNSSEQYCV